MCRGLRVDVGIVERSRLRSRHLGRCDPLPVPRLRKSVNKINNKCAKRGRHDYGSLMHQSPGMPVATTRLMNARIAALAAQLEAASLPCERERLRALLLALQTAFAARHGPSADDKHSREKYARTHSDGPAETAMARTDEGGACDRTPRSDLPIG